MCSGALLNARLRRVVFGAAEPKTGSAGSVINLFEQAKLNHQTRVQGGVLADQSRVLMQDFFRQRRTVQREESAQRHPLRDYALRTLDSRFKDLPAYSWQPHYVNDLLTLGGLRMHYLDEQGCCGDKEEGSARQLTYLCLHGHTGWSYEFRHLIPSLVQAGHRVIAPDLIGFGKSDKPKKTDFHTFSRHRQILLELVERLDLKNMVLVLPARSGRLGLTLPMAGPWRYRNVRILDAKRATYDLPLSAGYLLWQEMGVPAPDVGQSLGATHGPAQMGPEDSVASDAPFPGKGHRAALRAFPSIAMCGETADAAQQFWLALRKEQR